MREVVRCVKEGGEDRGGSVCGRLGDVGMCEGGG